ncbi:MAG: hypothetical protein ACTSRA_12890 [Promethearchaeota archaeon]
MKKIKSQPKNLGSLSRSVKAGGIVLVAFGMLLIGFGLTFQIEHKYATILYHYNAEYRAGNTDVENAIINIAIPELINMYYRHPEWCWTLELQGWAIENMSIERPDAFNKLVAMINRGQCELITPLWSYQLAAAFPREDLEFSLNITRECLENLGINRFSRVLFFQESQSFPGFGNPAFRRLGFDTCMIGTHTLALHGIQPRASLYRSKLWNDPSTSFYYLPYNWVPEPVSDGFHIWTFLATGETVTGRNVLTAQGTGQGQEAYLPDPDLILSHEDHLQKLHDSGYDLLTINDYVTRLVDRGEYMDLDEYVPETTWRDLPGITASRDDSNCLWTWMGYNTKPANSTRPGNDDGAQLAETYRTGIFLKAVNALLNANTNKLDVTSIEQLNSTLIDAFKHYFKAQGTDAYGWEPSWIIDNVLHESDYSRNNNREAFIKGNWVLGNLSSKLGIGDQVQVYLYNTTENNPSFLFNNETSSWINETCVPVSSSLASIPLELEISLEPATMNYSSIVMNCSYGGFSYQEVEIIIPELSKLRMKISDDYPIWYCPTFHEDRAQEFILHGEEPYYLPLSNGLVFLGSPDQGIAVIKNCSSRHVSLEVNKDWIGFREECKEGYTVKDVKYSLIISECTLSDAIKLADFVNIRPIVNLVVPT